MFLNKPLEDFFKRGKNPRVTVKTKQVVDDLNRQVKQTIRHYQDEVGLFERGASFLADMINSACDPQQGYNPEDDDYNRYTRSLVPRINGLVAGFDPVLGRKTSQKWFIGNKTCHECVFTASADKPFTDYPMNGDWSNYRPLRMVYHDSAELSLWITSGYLAFKRNYPYVAFYTFDLAAAALQWTYLSKQTPDLDIRTYIHKYLILPAVTWDNVTIWMLGNYNQWFSSYQRDYQDIPFFDNQYVHIPQRMNSAQREVGQLIDSARLGSVTPEKLICGLPLPDGKTIASYYTELSELANIPEMTQYYWGDLLKYKIILQLVIAALSCNIKDPETATLIKRFYIQAQYLKMSSVTKLIYDHYLKASVKMFIDHLYLAFKKMRDMSTDGI